MSDKPSAPALPGEECKVPPRDGWSNLEKWIWQEVGSGRPANINNKLGWCALPYRDDGWGPERQVSSEFLTTILLHDPWRDALPRAAVRIFGALFTKTIDLRWTELPMALWIDRSRFLAPVVLSGVRAGRDLSFRGSMFQDQLFLRVCEDCWLIVPAPRFRIRHDHCSRGDCWWSSHLSPFKNPLDA